MTSNKKNILETFDTFLDSFQNDNYGKCYFKLKDGTACQGWITDINEDTFLFHDSGPLSKDVPYMLKIEDLDTNTLAYWDEEIKKWTEYFGNDKIANRLR